MMILIDGSMLYIVTTLPLLYLTSTNFLCQIIRFHLGFESIFYNVITNSHVSDNFDASVPWCDGLYVFCSIFVALYYISMHCLLHRHLIETVLILLIYINKLHIAG